jgi:hypothetical protein
MLFLLILLGRLEMKGWKNKSNMKRKDEKLKNGTLEEPHD